MPYISTKTNASISAHQEDALTKKFGEIITLVPGKSERWLMLSFQGESHMRFAGSGEEKMAFVEFKLFGSAPDSVYDKLTPAICSALSEVLGIEPGDVYVKYEQAEHWGWNNSNF